MMMYQWDPNSLPSLQHKPPGMMPGPVQLLPFQPGLRGPTGGGTPGMGMPQAAQGGQGMGEGMGQMGAGLDALLKLYGNSYTGDPAASAAYGSARPAVPADVMAGSGWIGGGV